MKLSITSLLEASKLLATKSGQELAELIDFVNDLADQTIRVLRQGITIRDNFKAELMTATLKNNVEQTINYKGQQIYEVRPLRVVSAVYGVDSFHWYLNNANQLVVKLGFTNSPTEAQTVNLAIFYE